MHLLRLLMNEKAMAYYSLLAGSGRAVGIIICLAIWRCRPRSSRLTQAVSRRRITVRASREFHQDLCHASATETWGIVSLQARRVRRSDGCQPTKPTTRRTVCGLRWSLSWVFAARTVQLCVCALGFIHRLLGPCIRSF